MAQARARLVIDRSQMQAVLTGPQSAAVQLVERALRQTHNLARLRSPVDTGQLRNSHVVEPVVVRGNRVTGQVTATGSAGQEYALAVHEGTRPHVIRPRRKKVLSWKGPEGRVFAREVQHPGTQARPWLLNATQEVGARLGFVVSKEG